MCCVLGTPGTKAQPYLEFVHLVPLQPSKPAPLNVEFGKDTTVGILQKLQDPGAH